MFDLLLFLAAAAPVSAASDAPVPVFGTETAVDETALERATARQDVNQVSNSDQAAEVSNSSVSGNVQTGTAAFSDNAFQNVSGLTVINANTGNNVAINGAIVVNVAISPGP